MTEEAQIRRQKLEKLQALGMDPFPKVHNRNTTCEQALGFFANNELEGKIVILAGRVMTIRVHGGMMFADLQDATGKIQLAFKEDEIGIETFERFRDLIDPGDFVEAVGSLFVTKRGEKSCQVQSWRILTKALLPLPEKWHGLKDIEVRYRHRELDLLSNPDIRERFVLRSRLVSSMRRFLDERGFMEVETPILHSLAGGANARPFITHHNALNADFYLRIATELHLKRLVVGGFEKVYEIGRCFRNEGIDPTHNPEFTMIELYWAFAGKEVMLGFLEEMMTFMVREALQTLHVPSQHGALDFTPAWPRITFRQAILEATGIDIDTCQTEADVLAAVKAKGLTIDFKGCIGRGEYFDQLYKKTARLKIMQPTWVLDYPVEMKPLANRSPEDPSKAAVAQLVVLGAEIINAYYYELNDPIDQRQRFMEQQSLADQGSEESQPLDEEFLESLEHGMPPTSGMGMGIDRLVSLLTDSGSLKEVILFPTLRPVNDQAVSAEVPSHEV